ncbi:MAG: dihydrofolate reductase [Ferruginibacter sp.]|nr:dihydrofolate reductase [Ferruginibacter sp.]
MISFIVAASENNAIGKQGQLLWHLPRDLKFFKDTTWGMPVIMGRKTYESVDRPLPGRVNIVITTQDNWQRDDVIKVSTIDEAIREAEKTNCKEIFIIGGGEIYRQSLPLADKIYLTRVHATLEGDAFFPALDKAWLLERAVDFQPDEKHAYAYTFETWTRKKVNAQ